jgi:RNA polymerase sigma-70 factor (ECF subfamily)
VERHQLGRIEADRRDDGRRSPGPGEGGRLSAEVHTLVASLARDSTHRLVAALARRLGAGRIATAEDAVQHALLQALSLWPFKGVPARPEAWLAVVARNRALDLLRNESRGLALAEDLVPLAPPTVESEGHFDRELNDDELALLFAVCHPALSPEMRVTFALKTVCGLTVRQIAAGMLGEPTAIAQRLVRARRQLEAAGVVIEAPPPEALPERAETVRTALYLMFNEGYSASSGEALVQPEFCVEAVRLARALAQHPMTMGPASDALAALLALTAARLPTRVGPDGVAQLLEDQPRDQWDRNLIALGLAHLEHSARGADLTIWHLRAEIASLHAMAPSAAETNWPRIASIYGDLLALDRSPVVELARAVAVGRAQGAAAGLAAVPAIEGSPYAEAARGVFLSELGRSEEARRHFERALKLARTEPERRLMERRLRS